MVALFRTAEDALGIAPDRFIRTTDPDHHRAPPGDGPPGLRQRRHLPGHLRGLVLPQRGLPQRQRPHRGRDRRPLPEPPGRGAPVAHRAQLVLPPLGLPGTAAALLRGASRLGRSRSTAATRCSASSARASRTSRSAARPSAGASRSPSATDGSSAQLPDGSWDPAAGIDLRLVRRAHQLHHRRRASPTTRRASRVVAGRPARHRQGHQPLPHDHLAGDAHERRAAAAAQGLGPRLAAGPGRADEQEPRQLPRAGRRRGRARRATARATCTLREVAFDKDTDVSWDSFVRRYNADLANDFGNLINRTRLDGQPLPRRRAAGARRGRRSLAAAWPSAAGATPASSRRCLLHEALATLWRFVGRGQPLRRRASSRGSWPRPPRPATTAAGERLRGRPRRPARGVPGHRPGRGAVHARAAPRVLAQLGIRVSRTRPTATAGRRSPTGCAGAPRRGAGASRDGRPRSSRAWTSTPTPPAAEDRAAVGPTEPG